MVWKAGINAIPKDLRQAWFRGETFHVDGAEYVGGRRTVVHQFPGGDTPLPEDLGRNARQFTINAFVLGPDYFPVRDALREALEQPGPGSLIHPYLGRMTVQVGEVRLRETTDEGGVARFTITFHEAGPIPLAVFPNTSGLAKKAAEKSIAASIADFGKKFSALRMAVEHVQELQQNVTDVLSAAGRLTTDVTNNVAALIRAPAELAAGIAGSLNRIRAALNSPLDAFGIYGGLFGASAGASASPFSTSARARQAQSRAALENIVRRIAVAEAANSLADADFDNAAQAGALRNRLIGALDGLLGNAPDDVFGTLVDLRAAVAKDIAARGADLARIVAYTPPVTMPALVIAHRLYGDPAPAEDLIARNHIRHPGFVPGGAPLEVRTDA